MTPTESLHAMGSMSAEDLPPRWYVVDRDGLATLCASESDALHVAEDSRLQWPQRGPYRAVLMGDVAQERERWISGARVQIPTATMEQEIQSHVRRAVAAERERCAKLCDDEARMLADSAHQIHGAAYGRQMAGVNAATNCAKAIRAQDQG